MSISEACQLILQAATMGRTNEHGGDIFVLKMGDPVRIVDLARDLIRLSGREASDVDIVFTGLRPGEKLSEELIGAGEDVVPTGHEKIMVLRAHGNDAGLDETLLRELASAARAQDSAAIRTLLQRLVPEFAPTPD